MEGGITKGTPLMVRKRMYSACAAKFLFFLKKLTKNIINRFGEGFYFTHHYTQNIHACMHTRMLIHSHTKSYVHSLVGLRTMIELVTLKLLPFFHQSRCHPTTTTTTTLPPTLQADRTGTRKYHTKA